VIIRDASHNTLDTITVIEAWETQSSVVFLQHVVIVRLHTLLLDPTLDVSVRFTRRKRVVGIVPLVRLKATLSVAFPLLGNLIAQQSAGAEVYFRPRQRRWRRLKLRVCDVFNVFEIGNCVQVFDLIFVRFEFMTLSGFNASGGPVNSQILGNLKD
jgi:hypothetical protein